MHDAHAVHMPQLMINVINVARAAHNQSRSIRVLLMANANLFVMRICGGAYCLPS